jgi:hypothetical protein
MRNLIGVAVILVTAGCLHVLTGWGFVSSLDSVVRVTFLWWSGNLVADLFDQATSRRAQQDKQRGG